MSSPICPKRGIAGIILAFALALFTVPAAVAAPVNLAGTTHRRRGAADDQALSERPWRRRSSAAFP